ncbi:hypothetical protein TYRP_008658 [Tyrophagus putrescentiae]|nr:hypothetical protein TYRP_008658 [Tyrophagus putrescentiae]
MEKKQEEEKVEQSLVMTRTVFDQEKAELVNETKNQSFEAVRLEKEEDSPQLPFSIDNLIKKSSFESSSSLLPSASPALPANSNHQSSSENFFMLFKDSYPLSAASSAEQLKPLSTPYQPSTTSSFSTSNTTTTTTSMHHNHRKSSGQSKFSIDEMLYKLGNNSTANSNSNGNNRPTSHLNAHHPVKSGNSGGKSNHHHRHPQHNESNRRHQQKQGSTLSFKAGLEQSSSIEAVQKQGAEQGKLTGNQYPYLYHHQNHPQPHHQQQQQQNQNQSGKTTFGNGHNHHQKQLQQQQLSAKQMDSICSSHHHLDTPSSSPVKPVTAQQHPVFSSHPFGSSSAFINSSKAFLASNIAAVAAAAAAAAAATNPLMMPMMPFPLALTGNSGGAGGGGHQMMTGNGSGNGNGRQPTLTMPQLAAQLSAQLAAAAAAAADSNSVSGGVLPREFTLGIPFHPAQVFVNTSQL